MNQYYEMIINMAMTAIIMSIKNPDSMRRLKPVLFKIAALIAIAAEQIGVKAELAEKIESEKKKAGI